MAVSTRKAGKSRRQAAGRGQTIAAIANVVEAEIVPRLLAAHQARLRGDATPAHALPAGAPQGQGASTGTTGAGTMAAGAMQPVFIAAFAAELIASDEAAVQVRIARLRQEGMSAEAVCLDVLAAAARHLGDLWVADRCSFIEVTTGAALLHRMMNTLRPAFAVRPACGMRARRAMLAAAPGEQHRFGLSMLAEFFRKDGWQVALPNATTIAQVVANASGRPLDMIGLSAGSDRHLGALAACIAALRASVANPSLVIMVGGPIFLERPDLVRMVGADATAPDAETAVQRATELLRQRRAAIPKGGASLSLLSPAPRRVAAAASDQAVGALLAR